jgi:hypothetical protein
MVVLPGLFAAFMLRAQVGFVDLGYHLRAGEWSWRHLHWLDRDIFTSTFHGDAWLNQNWLAQLGLYTTGRLFGIIGLVVLNSVLFTTGFVLLFRLCRRRTGEARVAAIATVVAVLPAVYNTAVRPQSFSWLLVAAVLLVLETSEDKPRRLYALPPLFALWANLHGAFAVGLAFLVVEAIAAGVAARRGTELPDRARLLGRITGLSMLAILVNPWGWRVYGYVIDIGSDATIRNAIEEWQPPRITETAGALFFISVGILIVALALSRARLGLRDLLRLGIAGVLGLLAIRNGLWWTMAAGPALATLLAPLGRPMKASGEGSPRMNLAFVGATFVIVLLASPWLRASSPLIPEEHRPLVAEGTPIAAAQYLQSHDLEGAMFNTQGLGSYLEMATPRHRTFIDSRIEMFPSGLWSDYTALMSADPGWEDIVQRHNIGFAVLDRDPQAPLIEALRRHPGWQLEYTDAEVLVFTRTSRTTS